MDLSSSANEVDRGKGATRLETTRWTMVLAAGQGSRKALEELCALYRDPVYAFFRRSRSAEDAQDLTQGFFSRLLEKNDIAAADPARGRFRNWLLTAARSFRANESDRQSAAKRGGRLEHLSIEAAAEEGRCIADLKDGLTPEQAYERRWAITVLERALRGLAQEYAGRGQSPRFEKIALCLTGDNEQTQKEIARELGMEHGAFRVHVHRCKQRLGELLAEEVAHTVTVTSGRDDVEEELLFLREVLSSR